MNMAIAGAAVTGISYGAQVSTVLVLHLVRADASTRRRQPLAFAIPSEITPRKYRVVANLGANVVSLSFRLAIAMYTDS